MNTERLATLTSLPLASPSSNGVGATERACALAGKVKPAQATNVVGKTRQGRKKTVRICAHVFESRRTLVQHKKSPSNFL